MLKLREQCNKPSIDGGTMAMTAKSRWTWLAIVIVLGAFAIPKQAGAIEVKKMMGGGSSGGNAGGDSGGPAPANPISKNMASQLSDTISQESEQYLDQESEKKSNGEDYVDLEHAQFKYIPEQKEGKTFVKARLEAPEMKGSKTGKAKPTGKRKVLVFDYRLDGSKWTEAEQPKWEDVDTAAAKK